MPQLASVGHLMNPRGGKWTPRNLGSSLLAWWSADRSDLITLSGSQVSHWLDVVAGYDATQAVSGARPLYSATSFNGSPGVTFDGIDDELTLASQPFPSGASPSELWGLVDQQTTVADANGKVVVGYGGSSGQGAQRRLIRARIGGDNHVNGQTGDGVSATSADVNGDFTGRHVARASFGATSTFAAFDGTTGTPAAVIPATGTTQLRLGAAPNNTAASFFMGVMRDAIVTGPLTTAQAALLETYLYNRRNP